MYLEKNDAVGISVLNFKFNKIVNFYAIFRKQSSI